MRVTAAERSSAGLLPTPPLPPTLMTQDNDVLSPSEAEEEQGAKEKGEKKKRKLKTIGLGGAASVGGRRGGLLPAPSVGSLSEGGSVVAGGGESL